MRRILPMKRVLSCELPSPLVGRAVLPPVWPALLSFELHRNIERFAGVLAGEEAVVPSGSIQQLAVVFAGEGQREVENPLAAVMAQRLVGHRGTFGVAQRADGLADPRHLLRADG